MTPPAFVTERKPQPPWDDCTLCAGAMLVDHATAGRIRPTRAQMRLASGVPDRPGLPDGTTLIDVRAAIGRLASQVENELVAPPTWSSLMAVLEAGAGAVLQGSYAALPAHYRRWDAGFAAGHAVFVMFDDENRLWWMDPLGPEGWTGEPIADVDARHYAEAFAAGAISALGAPQEDPVSVVVERWVELPAGQLGTVMRIARRWDDDPPHKQLPDLAPGPQHVAHRVTIPAGLAIHGTFFRVQDPAGPSLVDVDDVALLPVTDPAAVLQDRLDRIVAVAKGAA